MYVHNISGLCHHVIEGKQEDISCIFIRNLEVSCQQNEFRIIAYF